MAKIFFTPAKETAISRPMPDLEHIHKELKRNGVNKKLLWREYIEHCRLSKQQPLMYSQFCYYIQQDEEKRQATMHLPRKPGERIEVDWAGDPTYITNRVTGEKIKALAEAVLDRIIHDAYELRIEAIDPNKDISMREF